MPAKISVYERVLQQQAGREPVRLAKKLDLIAGDPFAFFRGTAELFYESLPAVRLLHDSPLVLCCGDLHLENLGSFRGANRLVYFDLNDFDEACVAPLAFEVTRFVSSIHAGAASLSLSEKQADRLSRSFVTRYAQVLAVGKPAWLERLTARGLVKQLLEGLRERHRNTLLGERTRVKNGVRKLREDGKRILAISAKEKKHVAACLKVYAGKQADPRFYRVLDIGARVAGNGSLGLPRYIVLVAGHGGPDGQYLLDLKAANPSALAAHAPCKQPAWRVEGERVTGVQKVMVAMAPALLAPVMLHGESFVLKELQPTADRLDLDATRGDLLTLTEVIEDMAQLTAWAQLRGCARYGAALPEDLMRFGARGDWQAPLLKAARVAAERNLTQWQAFRAEHLQRALRGAGKPADEVVGHGAGEKGAAKKEKVKSKGKATSRAMIKGKGNIKAQPKSAKAKVKVKAKGR
ncbi:MAG TPA: DUF2252 family protein [Burkholderiales bacterium]|jgi:uncharacterized protein (DUF2252 family)|nr:DUF2252 family protein [Burkholderiales bacterium]